MAKNMQKVKGNPTLTCTHRSYDLDGWEGGIAVYGMSGEHGTRIIAIPRIGMSTCLTGYHDSDAVYTMLEKNRTLYHDRQQRDLLAGRILTDFKSIGTTE